MKKNTLLDIAQRRASVREYNNRPIESDTLRYIFETVRLAPSAVNYQPWVFITISSDEGRSKLVECYPRTWFEQAPYYVLACGNHQTSWHRKEDNKDHCDIDVAIAIEHLCLAAAEQGVGTCWVCNFDAKRCQILFDLPAHIEPIAIIAMGYPANPDIWNNTNKIRKPYNEIVRCEKF